MGRTHGVLEFALESEVLALLAEVAVLAGTETFLHVAVPLLVTSAGEEGVRTVPLLFLTFLATEAKVTGAESSLVGTVSVAIAGNVVICAIKLLSLAVLASETRVTGALTSAFCAGSVARAGFVVSSAAHGDTFALHAAVREITVALARLLFADTFVGTGGLGVHTGETEEFTVLAFEAGLAHTAFLSAGPVAGTSISLIHLQTLGTCYFTGITAEPRETATASDLVAESLTGTGSFALGTGGSTFFTGVAVERGSALTAEFGVAEAHSGTGEFFEETGGVLEFTGLPVVRVVTGATQLGVAGTVVVTGVLHAGVFVDLVTVFAVIGFSAFAAFFGVASTVARAFVRIVLEETGSGRFLALLALVPRETSASLFRVAVSLVVTVGFITGTRMEFFDGTVISAEAVLTLAAFYRVASTVAGTLVFCVETVSSSSFATVTGERTGTGTTTHRVAFTSSTATNCV